MRKIKILRIVSLIIVTLIIFLCVTPIYINRVYDAIEIKLDDPTYLTNCQITVSGYYFLNLFTNDTLKGKIVVSDYLFTRDEMESIEFSSYGAPLFYYQYDDDSTNAYPNRIEYCLGKLFTNLFLREICITVLSDNPKNKASESKPSGNWGGWSPEDGYCIVASVSTREDALRILQNYELAITA
jgi:hypothetical protein